MKNLSIRNLCITSLQLLLASACRPVITVGWGEIAFIVVLILLLMGPLLFKLLRKMAEFQAWRKSSDDKKK